MGVGTQIELDLYVDIQSAFEEDIKCEHSQHDGRHTSHSGDAAWYLQIQCPNCGHTNTLKPVCDPWKAEVEAGTSILCSKGCRTDSYNWNMIVCEKIRK